MFHAIPSPPPRRHEEYGERQRRLICLFQLFQLLEGLPAPDRCRCPATPYFQATRTLTLRLGQLFLYSQPDQRENLELTLRKRRTSGTRCAVIPKTSAAGLYSGFRFRMTISRWQFQTGAEDRSQSVIIFESGEREG
jgi:hypothetical protein